MLNSRPSPHYLIWLCKFACLGLVSNVIVSMRANQHGSVPQAHLATLNIICSGVRRRSLLYLPLNSFHPIECYLIYYNGFFECAARASEHLHLHDAWHGVAIGKLAAAGQACSILGCWDGHEDGLGPFLIRLVLVPIQQCCSTAPALHQQPRRPQGVSGHVCVQRQRALRDCMHALYSIHHTSIRRRV